MKKLKNKINLPIIALIFLNIVLFWPFFFKGLHPFPGNLLLSWHEPYRSDYYIDGKIILPNKPVVDDAFKHVYPLRILSIDMFKKFEFPLWNPYNGAGQPLLAGINNGNLDPFNMLFFVMPYPFAWSTYVMFQPLLIATCIYLYCRKISLSQFSSLFTSVAFMLSGFVTVKAVFSIYGLAIATLPLLLYLIECYMQSGIAKRTFLIPILIFIMIVSALPQISLYIIGFTCLYFLFRIIQSRNMTAQKVLPITMLFILGLGLSSLQLLPTIELFNQANISTQDSTFIIDKFLVPIQHLLSILIPNFFGNEALYNYWGTADYEQTIAAIGLIPCFFAILGIGKNKKITIQPFLIITIIVTVSLAVDWIGSRAFFSLPIPIVSTAAPTRIFLLTTFSICVLAGFGFDRFISQKTNSKIFFVKVLLFITAVAAIFTVTFLNFYNNVPCRFGVVVTCRTVALRNTILETAVFSIALIPFFTYLFLSKVSSIRKTIPIAILIITTAIGIYNANKFFPYSKESTFFPKHQLIETLKEKTQYARSFGIGEATITPNIATQLRLYDPQYFHPLYILRYRELLEYANNGKYIEKLPRGEAHIRSESTSNPQLLERRARLLNLLSVSYLIFKKQEVKKHGNILWENDKSYITENKASLPRVYLAKNFEVIKSQEKILKILFDPKFDIYNSVVLEESPQLNISESLKKDGENPSIKKYSENSVDIKTNSSTNSILVLSDNYYPGWKAYVDKKETKIFRANYTFRAIEVPQGKHTVTFIYKPDSFYMGAGISTISLFVLGLIFFYQSKGYTKLLANQKKP